MNEPAEKLWTCIARCQVCKKELNRARHVPESARTQVALAAPLLAICSERGHSTLSDCNIGVELEWVEEKKDGDDVEVVPTETEPERSSQREERHHDAR